MKSNPPWAPLCKKKTAHQKMSGSRFIILQSCVFTQLWRHNTESYCKQCKFNGKRSISRLSEGHLTCFKLRKIRHVTLNCYIPEAFKNRRISSAENGCRTEASEQIWTGAVRYRIFNNKHLCMSYSRTHSSTAHFIFQLKLCGSIYTSVIWCDFSPISLLDY